MKLFPIYIILSIICVAFFSCRDDEYTYNNDGLTFSKDTIFFDTIFTRVGSVTKRLKIYNFTTNDIIIQSLYLKKGEKSQFRLNIDGYAANQRDNIKLKSQDSMFVFVEVTVDPTMDKSPMVIEDSIVVATKDQIKNINLLAWGQNMKLYRSWYSDEGVIKTTTWTNEFPYLIYGSVYVDTNEVLTIQAGTKVYFHRYSSLAVQGTLIVNGTKDDPVFFQNSRRDELFEGYSYSDVPGQWGTIAFIDESKDNVINYAIIKNASAGMQVGEPNETNKTNISITNTFIDNMSGNGIVAWGASINASNTIISNCGSGTLGLFGGDHTFIHCTFADFGVDFSYRNNPTVSITNYAGYYEYIEEKNEFELKVFIDDLTKAHFYNCIIYGTQQNELLIADTNKAKMENIYFDYNLIQLKNEEIIEKYANYLNNNLFDFDPKVDSLFENIKEKKFYLDTSSYAIDKGWLNYARQVPNDYNGNSRTLDGKPDLGAYEFQK